MSDSEKVRKRFLIALSFAGERRGTIDPVAKILAKKFGEEKVLYDHFHRAEFNKPRLAISLPALYHDEAELIVVFLSAEYNKKGWCGLEWDAIVDLIKAKKESTIMLYNFGDQYDFPGLFSGAGFIDAEKYTSEEIAEQIIKRLNINKNEGNKVAQKDLHPISENTFEKPSKPAADAFISTENISALSEVFKSLSSSTDHYETLAYDWVNPKNPMNLEEARNRLRQIDDSERPTIEEKANLLILKCQAFGRNNSFSGWVKKRCALLEIFIDSPRVPDIEHTKPWIYLFRKLIKAFGELKTGKQTSAAASAFEVLQESLDVAAKHVSVILKKSYSKVSGNLMIPLGFDYQKKEPWFPGEIPKANFQRALTVWGSWAKKATKCLVIVGETPKPSGYLGFWIPLIQREKHLPGAPFAFSKSRGSAVFKNDLPMLQGFPDTMKKRWFSYMKKDFNEDMFLSIPLLNENNDTIAVFNINSVSSPDDGWKRAYHDEWLNIAINRASHYLALAYAAIIPQKIGDNDYSKIVLDKNNFSFLESFKEEASGK